MAVYLVIRRVYDRQSLWTVKLDKDFSANGEFSAVLRFPEKQAVI